MDDTGYAARAKEIWGDTREYREFERRAKGRTPDEERELQRRMMRIFAGFGAAKDGDPSSETARELVKQLRDFISAHFYTCTDDVLSCLGAMYAAGGPMAENIDRAGGEGTAAFAGRAVAAYCRK